MNTAPTGASGPSTVRSAASFHVEAPRGETCVVLTIYCSEEHAVWIKHSLMLHMLPLSVLRCSAAPEELRPCSSCRILQLCQPVSTVLSQRTLCHKAGSVASAPFISFYNICIVFVIWQRTFSELGHKPGRVLYGTFSYSWPSDKSYWLSLFC